MTWETQNSSHRRPPDCIGTSLPYADLTRAVHWKSSYITGAYSLCGFAYVRSVRGWSCTELCRRCRSGQFGEGQEAGPKKMTHNPLCFGTSPSSLSPSRRSRRSAISPLRPAIQLRVAQSNTGCPASTSRRPMCSRSCSPKSCVDWRQARRRGISPVGQRAVRLIPER